MPASKRNNRGNFINLLVCSACDHPLCTEDDVIRPKLEMPPRIGFSYEFDDVFDNSSSDDDEENGRGGHGGGALTQAQREEAAKRGEESPTADGGSSNTSGAPWCYRVNVCSEVILNTSALSASFIRPPRPAVTLPPSASAAAAAGGLPTPMNPYSSLTSLGSLSRSLAPVSDEDTASLMREGIRYQANGVGEISSVMLPAVQSPQQRPAAPAVAPPPPLLNSGDEEGAAGSVAAATRGQEGASAASNLAAVVESPTAQRVQQLMIPPTVSKTNRGSTDIIRVRTSIVGPAVVDRVDEGAAVRRQNKKDNPKAEGEEASDGSNSEENDDSNAYTPPDPNMREWFDGYTVKSQLLCTSCSQCLGWRFGAVPKKARKLEVDSLIVNTAAPAATVSTATNVIPAAVRSNPFGPRAPSVFGHASAATTASSAPPTAAEGATVPTTVGGESQPAVAMPPKAGVDEDADDDADDGFLALILKHVKYRRWSGRDVSRQCLVAAAVSRRQTLELLKASSFAAISAVSVATPTTATEPTGDRFVGGSEDSATTADANPPANTNNATHPTASLATATATAEAALTRALRESEHRARVQSVLEEDTVARRRLEALMTARINEAVEDRTRHLNLQVELIVSLLEKHKEQTTVLTQLLKGQKEKLRTQEDKLSTYEQIFVAHKRQLDTQTKHISFQDDLMKTLKVQTDCQQRQIESQQTILREQNGTIHKQNGHVREMQQYLRSLVESQVRMKQYLEDIAERDSNDNGGGERRIHTSATATTGDGEYVENLSPASIQVVRGDSTSVTASPSTAVPTTTIDPPRIVRHEEEEVTLPEKEGDAANDDDVSRKPPSASPSAPPSRPHVTGEMARKMLADLSLHEKRFGINYSNLETNSIAGRALLAAANTNRAANSSGVIDEGEDGDEAV